MNTRGLDALFKPKSLALIGASERRGSLGDVVARAVLTSGFKGRIDFVNLYGGTAHGRPLYRAVGSLPQDPEVAVIVTPAATVPAIVRDLADRGCRAVVILSAGFERADCASLRHDLLDAAGPAGPRILGPNCLGVIAPPVGLNASFARTSPSAGGLALVAQSGAVATAAIDWGLAHGLGFSHVVTLGDALDIDAADLLAHLGSDPEVKAILLYLEGVSDGVAFVQAARKAAQHKPIICLKGGRSPRGAVAAFSHTRALAGADDVYSAALRRAGVLQVQTLQELLDTALVCASGGDDGAGALAILTNGGGAAVLAVDALERRNGRLAVLSEATQGLLARSGARNAACVNPVDILGDADAGRYSTALRLLLAADEVDAVLAINCPTAAAPEKLVLAAWLGEAGVGAARRRLAQARLPSFATPEAAVDAFARLEEARRLRALAREEPPPRRAKVPIAARRAFARVMADGRTTLDPLEVAAVLRAYGIGHIAQSFAGTPEAAADRAALYGGPVALKIRSRDIAHKSDVGGVALDLSGRRATERAARRTLKRIRSMRPEARLDGFLVQPMIAVGKGHEVLAGIFRDPTFGPVVMVGQGGVAVEVMADKALALAPLDTVLAADLIAQTRMSRLLAGYRDRPPANRRALERILLALSAMALDLPEVAEVDLNPILCDQAGALVVDARIKLSSGERAIC